MTGEDDDRDDGGPDGVPIEVELDETLASDDSELLARLLDVLALLTDVGAARWVLHKAGQLALVLAPSGYGFLEPLAPEVIDASLSDLAEAGLVTIDEAVFDDTGDGDEDDADVAGGEPAGQPDGFESPEKADDALDEADDAWDEDVDYPEVLDDSAFDTVTVDPDAGKIIMARHVAAGTIAELGARACAMLEEAARSGAGIDYALLAAGMTACWDSLRPYLGPADDELIKDLLTMRRWGLSALDGYPNVSREEVIEFAERLVADDEQALGPGHPDAWGTRRGLAIDYESCGREDEAIAAFAELRADMERVLPADDREVLEARDDLALAYINAGRYQEAVREYTPLVADCERVLGPRQHPTLWARGKLGGAYVEVGRVAEGIELMEAAAAGLAAIAGPDDEEVTRLREAIDEARGQVLRARPAAALSPSQRANTSPTWSWSATIRSSLPPGAGAGWQVQLGEFANVIISFGKALHERRRRVSGWSRPVHSRLR